MISLGKFEVLAPYHISLHKTGSHDTCHSTVLCTISLKNTRKPELHHLLTSRYDFLFFSPLPFPSEYLTNNPVHQMLTLLLKGLRSSEPPKPHA